MNKLVGFLLILITLYMVAKSRNDGVDPIFSPDVDKSQTLEGDKNPEYITNEPSQELEGTDFEKFISKVVLNVMKTEKGRLIIEKILRPTNAPVEDSDFTVSTGTRKSIDNLFSIKDVEIGAGRGAVCGHKVSVEYKIVNMNDLIIDSGTKEVVLGGGKIFLGFDNVVVGMKEGGKRNALINKAFAYKHKGYKGKKPINETSDYRVEVKLLKVLSDMNIGEDVRIFDDKISLKVPLMCGDRTSFNVKIDEIGGKSILDTKKANSTMNFVLGDETFPIIFSHALFAKDDKGSRVVLLQGKYLKRFDSGLFGTMNKSLIEDNKYYLLEFSDVRYEKY
jgi:FKBP-type peptidyl-prolyl cis-trans isomerase